MAHTIKASLMAAALLASTGMIAGAHAQTPATPGGAATGTTPGMAMPGSTPAPTMPGAVTPTPTSPTATAPMNGSPTSTMPGNRTTGTATHGAAPHATAPHTNSAAPAAVNTTSAPSRTTAAPVAGANSFTEGEARRRIQAKGFGQVTDLKKDDKGIWRGMSTKDGKSMSVALDYQGNVVSQ